MSPVNQYTTIGGEMWDQISRKIYGKERWENVLMRANPAYLNVVRFNPGIVLTVPAIDTVTLISSVPWGSVYVLAQ
jgi:hypothetical protein